MTPIVIHALIWLPIATVTAVAMDLWAALLHGRVWHRWLWTVHVSHHVPRRGRFEANDALSILHAPIAMALILWGCASAPAPLREVAFGVGIGMTLFGVAYVVVHDGLVHQRLPVRVLLRLGYFRSVVRAHRVHHATPRGGVPYGFFLGPWELARSRKHGRPKRVTAQPTLRGPSQHSIGPDRSDA